MNTPPKSVNHVKPPLGLKVLRVVATPLAFVVPVYLLLMSGFILSVPVVAFLIWLFQQARGKNLKSNWKLGATLLVTSVALSAVMTWGIFRSTRRPDKYLIPQGYVGWVIVEYQVKGAEQLTQEDGHDLYRIPQSGRLQTSSPREDGIASDAYFYVSPRGRQPIHISGWGEGGLIWGGSTSDGSISVGGNQGSRTVQTPPTQTFFVGTEAQFQNAGPEPHSKQMEKIIEST